MSSFVGHALCGVSCLALAQRSAGGAVHFNGYGWLAGFALLACLPDLDFLVGFILANNFHQFHSGPSHSLFAVLLAVTVIGFALPAYRRNKILPWMFAALVSHSLIDLFTGPQLGFYKSYGVALFWPFDSERVRMPISLFYGVRHATMDALLSWYNVKVITAELASFGLIFLLLGRWARARTSIAHAE